MVNRYQVSLPPERIVTERRVPQPLESDRSRSYHYRFVFTQRVCDIQVPDLCSSAYNLGAMIVLLVLTVPPPNTDTRVAQTNAKLGDYLHLDPPAWNRTAMGNATI